MKKSKLRKKLAEKQETINRLHETINEYSKCVSDQDMKITQLEATVITISRWLKAQTEKNIQEKKERQSKNSIVYVDKID